MSVEVVIDLADSYAVRCTYGNVAEWRGKGNVLRNESGVRGEDPLATCPSSEWGRFLDLGCGLDGWSEPILRRANSKSTLVVCDLSESMLRRNLEEFRHLKVGMRAQIHCVGIMADAEVLPFADDSFDGIAAVFVGHHVKDSNAFVGELARVLRPDGWLLTNAWDWNFPVPDFPSMALKSLMGRPARFKVVNRFDPSNAKLRLKHHFVEIREWTIPISATFETKEPLIKFHSRLKCFISQALPVGYTWDAYLRHLESVLDEYLRKEGSYSLEYSPRYFLATKPRS